MVLVQRLLYQKIQKQQMDWLQTGWPIICSGLIQVFLLLFIFKGCKSLCVKHGELFWYSQGQNSLIKSTKVTGQKRPFWLLSNRQHLLQESLATATSTTRILSNRQQLLQQSDNKFFHFSIDFVFVSKHEYSVTRNLL